MASSVKAPARVYVRSEPLARTKKPSPWIAMSVLRFVVWIEPCRKFGAMLPNVMPRPTWMGLTPPFVAVGATPVVIVCPRMSLNTTLDDL